jgi:four helix bundle suffix protein
MRTDENNGRNRKNASRPIIPPRGDYQTLLSHQKAEVVYDITYRFAHKFLSKGDRTIDQQLRRLEKDFLDQGGLRERMTSARIASRKHPSLP